MSSQDGVLAQPDFCVRHAILQCTVMYRMQLRLRLDIKSLKGPVYLWMPPPPNDRLWFSFVTPPQLVATATPLVRSSELTCSHLANFWGRF